MINKNSMWQVKSNLYHLRWWFLIAFVLNSVFIGGNSLVSSEESSDLSTSVSEVIVNVARAVLPPADVVITPAISLNLSLRDQATAIFIGTSNRINVTFDPETTTDKSLTWTTSNSQIIEVTNGGIAIARNFGFATITATTVTDSVFGELLIEVIDFPNLSNFSIEAIIGDSITTKIEKDTTAKILITNPQPANAKLEGIEFTSSQPTVASVSAEGIIKGLAVGTAIIQAAVNGITKTLMIEIVDTMDVIAPTFFTLTGDTKGYVGRPFQLVANFGTILPTDRQTTFISSNPNIARVNDLGVITPVNFWGYQSQSVTITGFSNVNPSLRDQIIVTIEKVFPINLSIRTLTRLESGKTANITPTFNPTDVTDRQLTYVSSNPAIATVSSAGDFGVIVGRQRGTVTITAISFMNPEIQATLQIEIIPASLLTPDIIRNIYFFVRKGIGHIGLNFLNGILGFLTFYTFSISNKKRHYLILTFLAGFGLAVFFEGLQFFAPGRSPTWTDVIYNYIGYTFAQLIMLSIVSVLDFRHFKVWLKRHSDEKDKSL